MSMGRFYPVNPNLPSPKELGLGQPPFRTQRVNLDAVSTFVEYPFAGTSFWVYDASSLDAVAKVRFQEQRADMIPAKLGLWVRGLPFSRLFIDVETAQANEWIEFAVVNEQALKEFGIETFEIQNALTGFNEIRFNRSRNLVTNANVTTSGAADLIAAADTTRRQALVQFVSNDAGLDFVYIGDSALPTNRGLKLRLGDTLVLDTSDEIYAYTNAGTTTLNVTEIKD